MDGTPRELIIDLFIRDADRRCKVLEELRQTQEAAKGLLGRRGNLVRGKLQEIHNILERTTVDLELRLENGSYVPLFKD